jgi:hypothetical protein
VIVTAVSVNTQQLRTAYLQVCVIQQGSRQGEEAPQATRPQAQGDLRT